MEKILSFIRNNLLLIHYSKQKMHASQLSPTEVHVSVLPASLQIRLLNFRKWIVLGKYWSATIAKDEANMVEIKRQGYRETVTKFEGANYGK